MTPLAALLRGDVPDGALPSPDDARRHKLAPLLVDRWAARNDAPAGVRDLVAALTEEVREAALLDALRMHELAVVTRALSGAGVTSLVFKGSALGPTVYGAPHLRPRADHDLLVEAADFDATRAVLEARGYSAPNQIPGDLANNAWAFGREDARGVFHVLDVHWRFNNGPTVAPALTPVALKERGVSCDALPGARIPCDTDALLLAAVHAYTHHAGQFHPLIWLVDIDRLAARLDDEGWRELLRLAAANDVRSVVRRALLDAHAQLGTALPPLLEAELLEEEWDDGAAVYLDGHPGLVMLKEIAGLPSWRARARMLKQLALPAGEYVLGEYGVADDRMLPRLYVHRLVRAVGRYALPRRRRAQKANG